MIPDNDTPFEAHGVYTISNTGGFLIELSPCGEYARMLDAYGSDNPKISEWKSIEPQEGEWDEDEERYEIDFVIDPEGYNIPLNLVMRI